VLKLVLRDVTVVEGRYGWDRLYLEHKWLLENENSELKMNRKERIFRNRI
jgi:hypothetical protein